MVWHVGGLQENFEHIMSKHGLEEKVCALLTDTPATMKAWWRKIEEKYPHVVAFGCWAHILQLFLKGESFTPMPEADLRRKGGC